MNFLNGDGLNVRGDFSMQVFEGENLIEKYEQKNLVVSLGKTNVTKVLAGDAAGKKVSLISVGTSGILPDVADAVMTTPFTKALDGYTFPDAASVLFSWSLDTTEANGMTILEFGLLNDDGILFARKTRSAIIKTNAIRIVGTWKITVS
jgi:hypothetical protein